jgi:acetate kinase
MSILVLNAGSSTLKFALFDQSARDELADGLVDWRGRGETATLTFRSPANDDKESSAEVADYGEAVCWILGSLASNGFDDPIKVVGHRVVHGGTDFSRTTLIDDQVSQSLERISELAPLHNPPALTTIVAMRRVLPDATQVAVFDTAFFANLPHRAIIYPVPYQWFEQYGIRRFGFHGISHAYCASRAAELLKRQDDANLRLVICHLGNGCSATAVRGGQPIATTMGFTPLEGLMMGTRSGSVDPSILLHLLQQKGFDAAQLDESLNRHSGLLGVSGVSSDFREVEKAARTGNQQAQLAIDMFADRIRAAIGAFAVTLGGIDALVFTAGIGEHSATLRSRVCDGLQCLNLLLDEEKNHGIPEDFDIARTNSASRILPIRTREEQMIAREAQHLFASLC